LTPSVKMTLISSPSTIALVKLFNVNGPEIAILLIPEPILAQSDNPPISFSIASSVRESTSPAE